MTLNPTTAQQATIKTSQPQTLNTQPLVTIITPTFNAAKTLLSCLGGVAAQDYPNIQHLVLDGGSTDATLDILRAHAKPGTWTSAPDINIFDAWNKGLARANGEWICFLGADDTMLPGAITAYMELAAQNPGVEYISSQVRWIDPSGGSRIIGSAWSWPRFQRYMSTAHVGSMHRRTFFEHYGQYDLSLPIVADYEILLRAGPNLKAAFLPRITIEMQGGGNSDNLEALDEAALVKVKTGHRARWKVALEHQWARMVYRIQHARGLRNLFLSQESAK